MPVDPIQEDIKFLKSSIQTLIPFLQDFKDLKMKNKISNENSISYSSLLTTVIKEEVLKDLSAINSVNKDQICLVNKQVERYKQETIEKFELFQNNLLGLDGMLSQTNENISSLRGHVNKFYDKFDEIQRSLEEKSGMTDLNEIRMKIKQFAFQSEVDIMNQEIYMKAPRETIDKLHKKIIKIEDQLPSFLKQYEVEDIKSRVKVDIESYLDLNFMIQEDFLTYKDIVHAKHLKFEDDFRGLAHKLETSNKSTKETLNRLSQKLSSKPWKKDVERIDKEMSKFTKISELKDLENSIFPALYKCQETMQGYGKKVDTFEVILQRYDEILLEKSSKDDIKLIWKEIKLLATSEDFESFNSSLTNSLSDTQGQVSVLNSQVLSIFNQLSNQSSKISGLIKDNKETSHVASTLGSISESLSQKADKIDFHTILDRTARRDLFDTLSEKCEIMQKQFELSSILNITLCRTLLGSGESSASVLKQRQDVFRRMQGLVGWVNGDEPRVKSTVPWKATPTVRHDLYLLKEDSLKALPRTARNETARIKMRPKRFTPRPEQISLDEKTSMNNTII